MVKIGTAYLRKEVRILKKFNFSDKATAAKIVYAAVIAILCITAIVVGIVTAASKKNGGEDVVPPPVVNENDGNNSNNNGGGVEDEPVVPKLSFIAPVVGEVTIHHDLTTPVFWVTLDEWRVHTGIDISCDDGASVFASEAGTVSGIYRDPMLGYTVEITHRDGIKTRYSNLSAELGELKVGSTVKRGDKIGVVGDTTVSELADEPHLHFEVLLKDVKVNPLDYINEESQKSSLGIK